LHNEELERILRTVKKHARLDDPASDRAYDILNNLGANSLVLSNRVAAASGFVDRLREHYDAERDTQLDVMDRILTTQQLQTFRQEQLKKVYEKLKDLEFIKGGLETKDHNNNEIYIRSLSNVRGRKVDLVALFGNDTLHEDWEEITLMGDMLLRSGADRVDLYLPFIPYQREDKKDKGRVPISAKKKFNDLKNAFQSKLNRIVTFELHSAQAQGYIDLPVDSINGNNLFANYVLSDYFQQKYAGKEFVVVSPDVGHAKLAKKFAELLCVNYVIIDKGDRETHGEAKINDRNIEDKVKGKVCLLIDDMCDTGGSLLEAYTNIMGYGAAGVVAMVGHGIFSLKRDDPNHISAEQKLKSCGIKIVTTDSIPRTQEYYKQNADWLDVLTITKKMAKVMIANRIDSSVGAVIDRNRNDIRKAREKGIKTNINDVLIRQ
jgi:ribose-phosphate pyrophosphokinase